MAATCLDALPLLFDAKSEHLEVWSDERRVVREEWRSQLDGAIRRSSAALVLVSPDFLDSHFIIDHEIPALVQHGVCLVYVLVRPALWQHEPMLERVQWAHDARRDGPLSGAPRATSGGIGRWWRRCAAYRPQRRHRHARGAARTRGVRGGMAVRRAIRHQPAQTSAVLSLAPAACRWNGFLRSAPPRR